MLTSATLKETQQAKAGKLWVGVTYALAEKGASNKVCAGIGVFGVAHATLHSVAWGMCVGGPAGAIAGAVCGL